MKKHRNKHNIAIIGAGPAGIACAVQLKRYGINFVIFEKDRVGGLLQNANLVENYPGFPEGINGKHLVSLLCRHISKYGIKPIRECVTLVNYRKEFLIRTLKNVYKSDIVVIASGTKPKRLNIEIPAGSETKIFYEVANLKKVNNKLIAIVGAGDASFDYALGLCRRNKVYLLNRSRVHKCLPVLFERAMKNKNIEYITCFDISKINLKNKKIILCSKNQTSIIVDYLVVAIGREPNLDFLEKSIKRKLKTLEKNKKLYMIGDVKNGLFRQTAIAVGDGIKTAMEIAMGYRLAESHPKM